MSASGLATATRDSRHDGAKPKSAGDCCTEAHSTDAGLPRFLDGVQTKLEVGAPDDAFEREAETVAEAVQRDEPVRAPRAASSVPRYQRLCADCAEQLAAVRSRPVDEGGVVQRLVDDSAGDAPAGTGGETSSGLASGVRARLERSLGADLGDVRVHTGPAADEMTHRLAAKAFTHGQDIWLGARQRPDDLGLMAHEVTHVLQQAGGMVPPGPAQHSSPDPHPPEDEDLAAGQISAKSSEPADDDGGDEDAGAEGGAGAAGSAEGGDEGRRDRETVLQHRGLRSVQHAIRTSGNGYSLAVQVRSGMERSFGADLRDVRVHDDDAAHHAADVVDAEAFSLGQEIYFGRGRYLPDSPAGQGLIAHELAHVVQNRRAGAVALPGAKALSFSSLSRPGDAAEREADSAAEAIWEGRPAQVTGTPTGRIQRAEKNAFGRALDWGAARLNQATDVVASGAKAAGEFAGQQLMKLLRAVAPQVADIIDEGPINFAKRKINEALDAHLPAALGGFSMGELIDAVSGWLGEAASFAKSLMKGDAKACAAFAGMMEKLTQFVTKLIDNPVIKTFTGALTKVSDFVGKAIKFIAAPIFDELAKEVSGAWSVMKKVASTVSGWISKAKQAIGGLWDQLMKALGFDGSSEDGVWAHIKKVGNEIWETIKAKMAPVIEPMKKVASVVSLLTPMGQVHAIVKYGPKLVKVAQWVWDNGLNPDKIRDAPEDIRGMLTDLTGGVSGFKGVLQSGLDWLSEKVSSLADAVLDVASSISGLPLIGYAHGLFDEAKKFLKTLVGDIEKGAKDALASIEDVATKIGDFIAPYKEVIGSLILAIASPPMIPVILAGWAWRALPSCVKVPILNFILDIAIAALEAIPTVPTFGLLWPLLKPGVMAFLGTLRAAEDKVKELVSDKIAKVISGASPEFLIGFVKGFATGVWEGITDPFKAIWTVLEGLDSATQYLLSLAGMGEEGEAKKEPAAGGEVTVLRAAAPAKAPAASAGAPPVGSAEPAPVPAAPVAAPAAPEAATAEKPYAADPAAALQSGAAMPESTRRLLEKLAVEQANAKAAEAKEAEQTEPAAVGGEAASVAPADIPALKERAGAMAGELSPDVETVKGGFWDAVQEYFSGDGMSFDDMVTKLSEAWESAKTKISQGAAWLANQLMGFFKGGGAEGELGDKIGWLTGTIVFQVLLDYITAGTWAGAGPVLKGIAKFINWPMEALGEAFKLLKTLGKYLLEGLKSLGSVIKDAAAGAFKTVSKALGNIGERLLAFGEEILGKFGGKAAKAETKAAGVLGKEGAKLSEREAAKLAEQRAAKQAAREAEQKTAQEAAQKGEGKAATEAEGQAAKEAEQTAKREAEEKAAKEGEEKAAKEAEEKAEQVGEAQLATYAVEAQVTALGGGVPELMEALQVEVRPHFKWIKGFEAERISPEVSQIFIRASRIPAGSFVKGRKAKKGAAEDDAKLARDQDPGGRDLWHMENKDMKKLTRKERAELAELQSRMPKSEDELERLVELRTKAAGRRLPEIAGTPEHMLLRRQEYTGAQGFDVWAAGHPSRMRNSVEGLAREGEYRTALSTRARKAENRVLKVEMPDGTTVHRQVDVFLPGKEPHCIQLKTGRESLTTTRLGGGGRPPALSNTEAIVADKALLEAGNKVTWVFEGEVSGQLVRELRAVEGAGNKISVVVGVADDEAKASLLKKLAREGVDPASITIVQGDADDILKAVKRMTRG